MKMEQADFPRPGPAATAEVSALRLKDITVRLAGRTVLSDVDLDVAPGEFIAVLGPNGAGKSTLMKTILGLVRVSSGTAEVQGGSPTQARSQIGYLPQRHSFDSSVRVRGLDLVALGLDGASWGIPIPLTPGARTRRREQKRRIADAIALVGAQDYAHRGLGELSGGEQQRLLIAQALVRRPRLLILDEPLDSLDLPNQISVAALLARISRGQGVAVLLVAHDVNPLLPYVDRVAYLAGGRALVGQVEDVITDRELSALYGSPIEVLRTREGRLVVVGLPEAPHHHGHRHGG
ncbi:MAG TPA: ABC transporter ATP-binding protein [Solirubrobacteraceae bacterium]|jgi:zinc/manganese transport system ATP-binding protein